MPTITKYVPEQGLDIGGTPSVDYDLSPFRMAAQQGAAIAGLGQDMARVAAHWRQREEETNRSNSRLVLQQGQQAINQSDISAAQTMPADGQGWVAGRLKHFDEQKTKIFEKLPKSLSPEAREDFEQRWMGLRGEYETKYLGQQVAQRTQWARSNIANQQTSASEAILQNPGEFANRKKDLLEWIEDQPLERLEKDEFRKKADLALGKSLLDGDSLRDPHRTRMGLGVPFISPRARSALAAILARDKQPEQHIDQMQPQFAEGLASFVNAASAEIGPGLGIMSGARSRERQQQLWDASDKTGRTVGSPDGSKHVHGQAADLTFNGKRLDNPSVPQSVRDWVKQNAPRFGLALPMDYEPWHIEDVTARRPNASGGRSRAVGALARGASISSYFAQSAQLPDFVAAALGGHAIEENGGRSIGKPGDSGTAFGTFQWRGKRLDNLKAYAAENGADWRDQKVQLDFARAEGEEGGKYADDGAVRAWRELRSARSVEDAVKAWMHFERPQGYTADRPENGHAYASRLQHAKSLMGQRGGTGGLDARPSGSEQLDEIEVRGEEPASVGLDSAPVDPRYADIPFSIRMQVANQLDARIQQLGVEKRADIDIAVDNAAAAIRATGEYGGATPSRADFVEAYGPVEGPRRAEAFQTSTRTARDVYSFQTMSNDAIKAAVQAARPSSSGPDAALQAARYGELQQAAAAALKARAEDPSTYVMQAFPNVRAAFAQAAPNGQVADPAAASRAIRLSFDAQRSLGITNIQPLSKEMADGVEAYFKDATKSQDERAALLARTVFATSDREQQRAILDQLVRAGVDPIVEGALEPLTRNNKGAAERLMAAAMLTVKDLPGKLAYSDDAIKKQLQSDVFGEDKIGNIAHGLDIGGDDAATTARAGRNSDLLERAVKLRLTKGQELSAAVADAAKDLFGDKEVFTASWGLNAKLLVDKDTDTGQLRAGLQALQPRVEDAIKGFLDLKPPAGVEKTPTALTIHKAAVEAQASRVLSEGVWRDHGEGVGFFDTYTGSFVRGRDGKVLTFDQDDIARAARDAPPGLIDRALKGFGDALRDENVSPGLTN